MRAYGANSKFLLPAVRNYVLLLVGTVAILSCSFVGYIYWRDSLHHRLEEAANHYHLETILFCSQIKEEMARIRSLRAETSRIYTTFW